MSRTSLGRIGATWMVGGFVTAGGAAAQPSTDLAHHFGFAEPRIIVVDPGVGPAVVARVNDDDRPDVIAVNNRKSRIELFYLRAEPRTDDEVIAGYRVNDLPPNPWYDSENISVAHRVVAVVAHDVNGDGKLDLIYAGNQPNELVVMRQNSPSDWSIHSRRPLRTGGQRAESLAVADVRGGPEPEVLVLVDGRISIYPLSAAGHLGDPEEIGAGGGLTALTIEDFNGDGMKDILAVAPDDAAPLRLWLQQQPMGMSDKAGLLASELRFEMPALMDARALRFADRPAASIGVIERASRRMVFFDVTTGGETAPPGAEREVLAEVVAFRGGASSARSVAVGDLDGDGLLDLLATDQKSHDVVLYRQISNLGLDAGTAFSTFKNPTGIALGEWDGQPGPEVFVLSEDERAVGVSHVDREQRRIAFPEPLQIRTGGGQPAAMQALTINDEPWAAVAVRDRRDFVLELHRAGEESQVTTIPLTGVGRAPRSILAADADRDGLTDLLLLTPGEPMVMVRGTSPTGDGDVAKPNQLLTNRDMPQFGLVQAAGPANTAIVDFTGDQLPELIIANANFIRACSYDVQRGWRVLDQVSIPDPSTDFVGLAVLEKDDETLLIAADKANRRLVIFGRDSAGRWGVRERIRLLGFPLGEIYAGQFVGDGSDSVLCISDDGFATVRLGGNRTRLEQFEAMRPEARDRMEHTMRAGDVNSDGHLDLVVLDAREQMCSIYTFTAARRILPATEFQVFQSRLFSRGQTREFEPSAAIITDLTGNGLGDLLLLVHDRLMIYPQMAE